MHHEVFVLSALTHTCVFQDRSRMYESLNMHSLESSLIDIMRAEQDPMKGKTAFPFYLHFGGEGCQRELIIFREVLHCAE